MSTTDGNDGTDAMERPSDAKRRPRNFESSDDAQLSQALPRRDAYAIEADRAAALGAAVDPHHAHERCGKCGSHDLLRVPSTPGDHSHIVSGDRRLRNVAVDKYVCTDCGHVEEWVNNKEDLQRLKEEWARHDRAARPDSTGAVK